ncbi:MAG: alanine/glycine:cation symporter family protein [Lachnospiraceae bacterium]
MAASLFAFLEKINAFLWNGPIILLLAATHLFFTIRLFPQRHTFRAIRLSVSPEEASSKKGLSGFATLATTLAATLGTGNIVGVSTAIALGGPGALFWCFLTGLFGMATSYAECFLSCLYRKQTSDGASVGGPMYVLEHGLKSKGLGKFYALCVVCAAIGAGCTTQSSAIADAAYSTWKLSPHIVGIAAAMLTGLVILGGVRSIGSFCTRLVPPLSFLYMGACLFLLWQNRAFLLPALSLVLSSAFTGRAAGGGFVGSTFLVAARFGIARGLFTNEAGIGTAAIAAGASGSTNPVRQALISMTAVFWDTIIMCTLTGFTIISSMLAHPGSADSFSDAGLTSAAFTFLPFGGTAFLTLSLTAFALATLVGWCYLGEKGAAYLFGETGVRSYHLVYIVMIYIGAVIPMNLVWGFTDLVNAIMVFPNVICLFLLFRQIKTPE